MKIKLMRHGLSGANTGEEDLTKIPDHKIRVVEAGIPALRKSGKKVGARYLRKAAVYLSPYNRTRQSLREALVGAGLLENATDELPFEVIEDPRLREIEHGYEGQLGIDEQKALRDLHAYFWYRLRGGESPADGYDRISDFLGSFWRHAKRRKFKKVFIVSHGLTIRVFVMRFFHLTVEEFDLMRSPENADVITIGLKSKMKNPQFTYGKWGVKGLRLTTDGAS